MEPPYKEKPQHWTGGNVFRAEGKETFIVGYFAKRLFASFQIHAAKIVIVLIIITITTLKKCKNASI